LFCRLAQRIVHGDVPEPLMNKKVEPATPLPMYLILKQTFKVVREISFRMSWLQTVVV